MKNRNFLAVAGRVFSLISLLITFYMPGKTFSGLSGKRDLTSLPHVKYTIIAFAWNNAPFFGSRSRQGSLGERAACPGAIHILFNQELQQGECKNGIVCENVSAQEAPAREGARLPCPHGHQERPQGSCPPPCPRPREADRFQPRLMMIREDAPGAPESA